MQKKLCGKTSISCVTFATYIQFITIFIYYLLYNPLITDVSLLFLWLLASQLVAQPVGKGTQELLLEQEPCAEARAQAAMSEPSASGLPLTHSVADLSATLSDLQEQVALLPDPLRKEDQTPFEPLPPLAARDRSPLDKRQRTRRGSNEATKHSTPKTAQAPAIAQPQQEQQDLLEQQAATSSLSSTHSAEMTSTIDERKQSFGIEARSTRWH